MALGRDGGRAAVWRSGGMEKGWRPVLRRDEGAAMRCSGLRRDRGVAADG
jgi:hypothetical protein